MTSATCAERGRDALGREGEGATAHDVTDLTDVLLLLLRLAVADKDDSGRRPPADLPLMLGDELVQQVKRSDDPVHVYARKLSSSRCSSPLPRSLPLSCIPHP
eukprot:268692-Hanusia_phi.AAC.2